MKILIIFKFLTAISTLEIPAFRGPTPPTFDCQNALCAGRTDGNYEIPSRQNYFVQCVAGLAYCQPCWPSTLVFSERCNQCLYNRDDECYTGIKRWGAVQAFSCPDMCPRKGFGFSGNIADPNEKRQYVACWQGVTVGCMACASNLEFNEEWNACLFDALFKTGPQEGPPSSPSTTTSTSTTIIKKLTSKPKKYYGHSEGVYKH